MGHSGRQSLSQCGFTQRVFYYTRLKVILMYGKILPSAENFQYTRINTGGYSLYRREGWKRQLSKHCVNV
jgi:hypothetical protein